MKDVSRNRLGLVVYSAVLVLLTAASCAAAQYGTAEEAKAMLDRAVAAVKQDKTGPIGLPPGIACCTEVELSAE